MPKKLKKLSTYVRDECGDNYREAGRKLGTDWTNIKRWATKEVAPSHLGESLLAAHGLIAG